MAKVIGAALILGGLGFLAKVKEFGPTVNLGNIPPDEVIPLETLRLGLRGDTLKEVLLPDERARTS